MESPERKRGGPWSPYFLFGSRRIGVRKALRQQGPHPRAPSRETPQSRVQSSAPRAGANPYALTAFSATSLENFPCVSVATARTVLPVASKAAV